MASALVTILGKNKLNGDNYTSWKNEMNTILVVEDLKFVLSELKPDTPATNAPKAVKDAYERWVRANEKARVCLMAGMSDVLAKKHEPMETALEIADSVQGMFGQPSKQARHEAIKSVYNTQMKEGTSVRDHVLTMMNYFNVAETNGAMIDDESQISFILESLPSSFFSFKSNLVMNKLSYSLTQLLNELQTFEAMKKENKKSGEANVVFNASKKKKSSTAKKTKLNAKKKAFKAETKEPKGRCFHCNIDGHWKRNCPKYLEEKKKGKEGKLDLLSEKFEKFILNG